MNIYEILDKNILNNDITKLREVIGGICHVRRDFSTGEFDELIKYVEDRGIKLKDDQLNGKLVSEGKSSYGEEDFATAIFELERNFCDERIADIKKIGRALYGKKNEESEESQPHSRKPNPVPGTNPNVQSHQKKRSTLKIVGILVAVVAVIYLLQTMIK